MPAICKVQDLIQLGEVVFARASENNSAHGMCRDVQKKPALPLVMQLARPLWSLLLVGGCSQCGRNRHIRTGQSMPGTELPTR
jgi:hypothetical protein